MQENNSLGKATSIWLDTTSCTNYPSLDGNMDVDVAVVGGGIAGLMIAYFLKEARFRVAVLESSRIATGTTGFTTAKITSAHGIIYKYLIDRFGKDKAQIYAHANQTAIEKMAELQNKLRIDCDFDRLPAFTYVSTSDHDQEIEDEVEAASVLGLPVTFVRETTLPYPISSAIRFENQAKFHPRKFLLKIATEINKKENNIFEETRILQIKEGQDNCKVITDKGEVTAQKVVVVTNYPIYDPAGFFARLTSRQSFTIGVKIDGLLPDGVFYGPEDHNFHSLRTQPWNKKEEILIIGGELYKTGQSVDTEKQYEILERWARKNFPVKSVKYHWTTSDSESYDRVPMIGKISPRSKNVFVATGFSGWGMTHSTVAGLILTDEIQGKHHPWSELYSPNRFSSFISARSIEENVRTISTLIKGKLEREEKGFNEIKGGEGEVREINGQKAAVYRDDKGKLHAVSAVCTHMGCIVGWNNAEKTWDCPCHGSRYDRNGKVIHGPAIKDLKQIEV